MSTKERNAVRLLDTKLDDKLAKYLMIGAILMLISVIIHDGDLASLLFFGAQVMGQPEAYINGLQAEITPEGGINDGGREVVSKWINAAVTCIEANK